MVYRKALDHEQLVQTCLTLLRRHPAGLSEYHLLKLLRDEEPILFPRLELNDQLGLFESHFLLYHTLYRLRDRLHDEKRATLQFSALLIELLDYRESEAALCEADPLRDYYLDMNNLDEMSRAGVAALLNDFWRRISMGEPERVASALQILELDSSADFNSAKTQYRRLVMQHHPDRGGDAAKMFALNEAMEVLRIHFNR